MDAQMLHLRFHGVVIAWTARTLGTGSGLGMDRATPTPSSFTKDSSLLEVVRR